MLTHFLLNMQQNANVTIDTDDDDDDDDVKQEVTQTIEKFVQNRHVQTLKYLQHVIDENRHLRLHIEHLKRRQDDPNPTPAVIDPIDSEDTPVSEIPPLSRFDLRTPQTADFEHCDQSTNTEGENDDFETKYNLLYEEMNNLKKQHQINRDEYQRELERVDHRNAILEKDLQLNQQQLFVVQKQLNEKQIELKNFNSSLDEMKMTNETLTNHVHRIEDKNRLLVESLTVSERIRLEFENQIDSFKIQRDDIQRKYSHLQTDHNKQQQTLENAMNEIYSLKEQLQIERNHVHEYKQETIELRETLNDFREQLQEKIVQEEKYQQEKQMNSNFKEFIQVKRNLQACQQENELLKIELKKLQIKLIK